MRTGKKKIIITLGICFLTAASAMGLKAEKKKVVAVCKDVRIGMEGTLSAEVEASRLTSQRSIKLFTLKNGHHVFMTSIDVSSVPVKKGSPVVEAYTGSGLSLNIGKLDKRQLATAQKKFPAMLQAQLDGRTVLSKMTCSPVMD